ncbi:MAG: winged helix-turn-helix domain-containing protein, partial [Chloroflexota bacterium]|nr:winged helix-turn-helix domain-containing protein [Chloroflexota bacterium]
GRRIEELEGRLEQMAYRSVRLRLVRFLVTHGRPSQEGHEVRGFSHEQIGEAIGAVRQSVTAELSRLQSERLIIVGRRRIRLQAIPTLKAMLELDECHVTV